MTNVKKNLLTWLGLTAVGFFIFGMPILSFFVRSDNLLLFSSKLGLFLGKLSFLLIFIYIILSFALFLVIVLFKKLEYKKVLIGWSYEVLTVSGSEIFTEKVMHDWIFARD